MSDKAFTAKFMKGEPVFVPLKLIKMSSPISDKTVEYWTIGDQRFVFSEILYNHSTASSYLFKKASNTLGMMEGPDMFHLSDENGNMKLNVWQLLRLKNTIEVVVYGDEDQQQQQQAHTFLLNIHAKSNEEVVQEIIHMVDSVWNIKEKVVRTKTDSTADIIFSF